MTESLHFGFQEFLLTSGGSSRELLEAEVERMKEAGLVQESDSPWSSPIVLARKPNGTLRFCVDYRKLNEVTARPPYPLPPVDEGLGTLRGQEYFTTLDLGGGTWQNELKPEDRPKTAFATRSGLYEFRVMPFGLTTAPATFNRLMNWRYTGYSGSGV